MSRKTRKKTANYRVMFTDGKRPKYQDVFDSVYEQHNDLDGDLDDALLILPIGATVRQFNRAMRDLDEMYANEGR